MDFKFSLILSAERSKEQHSPKLVFKFNLLTGFSSGFQKLDL